MKKSMVIALAMAAVSTSGAFAADLSTKKSTQPVPPVASATWTACYLGGHIGGALSSTKVTDEVSGYAITTLDSTAVSGGGQIGCDYQLSANSPWVLGVQGTYDVTGLSASKSPPLLEGADLSGEVPWIATLTARAGYLLSPDMMLYAKAGGAWTHTDSKISVSGVEIQSANYTQHGWTAGVGAEWKLASQFSVFIEYDYVGLMDKVVTFEPAPPTNIGNVAQDIHMILVGANFRFNGM